MKTIGKVLLLLFTLLVACPSEAEARARPYVWYTTPDEHTTIVYPPRPRARRTYRRPHVVYRYVTPSRYVPMSVTNKPVTHAGGPKTIINPYFKVKN